MRDFSSQAVAKSMWERTHDGRWEDWGDGQDESRNIYLADAEIAVSKFIEPLRAQLASARKFAEFIRDGYERSDISHVDFRVGAYKAALAVLTDDLRGEGK